MNRDCGLEGASIYTRELMAMRSAPRDQAILPRPSGRRRRAVPFTLGLVAIVARGGIASTVADMREARSEGRLYEGLRGSKSTDQETSGLRRQLPAISFGGLGQGFDVESEWGEASNDEEGGYEIERGDIATPPPWDSTLCMQHWGVDNYQTSLDPHGYVIYVNGREQLGGNKYLVSDGVFIAKSLGRTLVEYPVLDSRVSGGDSKLGLGAYWDLSQLCMYHRIIDLNAFRDLVARGVVTSADFLTVGNSNGREHPASHMHKKQDVREFFEEYASFKVIVMENTWKSSIDRDSLSYLRPNPFYMGIVRMLLDSQKEWNNGNYLALQWRTETATGNLTECYSAVKDVVEVHRKTLGLSRHQVFVNTDLMGDTSGTYKQWQQDERHVILDLIQNDYPQSFDNNLHRFIGQIEDSGVKAFVSGLAVASSRVMIASSLNMPETKAIPEANVCQKPFSGYITLISEWRAEILKKSEESTIRLFPFEM